MIVPTELQCEFIRRTDFYRCQLCGRTTYKPDSIRYEDQIRVMKDRRTQQRRKKDRRQKSLTHYDMMTAEARRRNEC